MSDSNVTAVRGMTLFTTDTTEAASIQEPLRGKHPFIRFVRATGGHASSKYTLYTVRKQYEGFISETGTTTNANIYLDADVSAGHVFNGHTMTTNDYLILQSSTGLALRKVASVTDDAAAMLLTVATVTNAPDQKGPLWVVRAADIYDVTIGNASVATEALSAQDAGTPVCIGVTSGDTTDVTGVVTIEYFDHN